MNLDRPVFDSFEYPFVVTRITLLNDNNEVTEWCVRGEAYVLPRVTYVFVMRKLVEREIIQFIRPGGTNNWNILH